MHYSRHLLHLGLLGCLLQASWGATCAIAQGRVISIEFLSDHNLLRANAKDVLTGGERYASIEWSSEPPRNAPITHTCGSSVRLKLRISFRLDHHPASTPFALEGSSPEPALCFRHEGTLPATGPVEVTVEGRAPLGPAIRKLQQQITWRLTLQPGTAKAQSFELSKSGPHVIYTTFGTPSHTDEPRHQVTEARMEVTIERMAAAQAKVGLDASSPKLVFELMKQVGQHYVPARHFPKAEAWKVPESWQLTPRGASCISIVEFVILVCRMIGMEGNVQMSAFYALPEKPGVPLRGGLGDAPLFKKDGAGNNLQLFLVDETNDRKGQVGGRGGMNFYESALEYEFKGVKYYFPGGTDRAYDRPEKVLHVFCTLAWVRWEPLIDDWVVMEVVHTYRKAGDNGPPSIALP